MAGGLHVAMICSPSDKNAANTHGLLVGNRKMRTRRSPAAFGAGCDKALAVRGSPEPLRLCLSQGPRLQQACAFSSQHTSQDDGQ